MIQISVRKRIICILLIVCCTATCFNSSKIEIQAAAKDVTNSVQGKHNIKALCKCFDFLCGVELTYQMEVGQKKKYDFSKESTRRDVLRKGYGAGSGLSYQLITGISVNEYSKRIFGKSTSKVGDVIVGNLGDGEYPEFKIKKIYKLSSGKYKVDINVNQFSSSAYTDKNRFRTGKLTVILKKNPSSYYGYIVKSMSLKKVGEIGLFSNWKAAYKYTLKNPNDMLLTNYSDFNIEYSWLYEMRYINGFDKYFLCDVNKDKIPELFIRFNSTGYTLTAVFTYRSGKLVYLGYNDFYGINKSRKLLLVYGHWHGASEHSGEEYTGYKIGKKELKYVFSTDWVVNGVINEDTKKAYEEDCKKYVKGCKKFSSFKKYKLSNMKGLKAQ